MAERRVCKCGFGRRAAAAGWSRLLLGPAMALVGVGLIDLHGAQVPGALALVALTVGVDIAAVWSNCRLDYCTGRMHWTATEYWPWLFLLTVFVTVAGLFAAGWPILAVGLEIYLLCRCAMEAFRGFDIARALPDEGEGPVDPDARYAFFRKMHQCMTFVILTMLTGATWLFSGGTPAWLEYVILTGLWTIAVLFLTIVAVQSYWRLTTESDHDSGFDTEIDDIDRIAARQIAGQAGWWLFNGGLLLLVCQLGLIGHTLLAMLYVLSIVFLWTLNVDNELRKPEAQRSEIGAALLALHGIVRSAIRAISDAITTPVRVVQRMLGRET